jgi:hypothetical protein
MRYQSIRENGLFHASKRQNKRARYSQRALPLPNMSEIPELPLAGLIALVHLVDDIGAAATFDNFAVTVAFFNGFQRVNDFHGCIFLNSGRTVQNGGYACQGF